MLDTIRQLSQAMKLKDTIINNFIPDEYAKGIEKRAVWNAEEDSWFVQVSQLFCPKMEIYFFHKIEIE